MSLVYDRRNYARSNMPAFKAYCHNRKRKPKLSDDKLVMAFYFFHNPVKAAKTACIKPKATVTLPAHYEMPMVLIGATKPTTKHTGPLGAATTNTFAVSGVQERMTVSEKVSSGMITIL